MKREIDGWVYREFEDAHEKGRVFQVTTNKRHATAVKVKIIVEKPEKTATISESEFEQLVGDVIVANSDYCGGSPDADSAQLGVDKLKLKLFGGDK